MTIIIFILPMNALKRLIAVIAGFVKAIRRRLREAVLFHAETGVAEKLKVFSMAKPLRNAWRMEKYFTCSEVFLAP